AVAEAADDEARRDAEVALGVAEAGEDGVVDLPEREALVGVEDGAVADLQVADVLGGGVLGQLVGDAVERLARLHHRDRVAEPGEVLFQRGRAVDLAELGGQAFLVRGGELVERALLPGEVEEGAEAEGPVEVAVELGLGPGQDGVARERGARGRGSGGGHVAFCGAKLPPGRRGRNARSVRRRAPPREAPVVLATLPASGRVVPRPEPRFRCLVSRPASLHSTATAMSLGPWEI